MGEMTFAFPTVRLRVFEASVTPWPGGGSHTVYLAFLSTEGAPQTVAQAIISDWRGATGPVLCPVYCELVEVSSMFQGNGYGEELVRGIEKHLGTEMATTAVTADGRKFLGKLGRNADALAPHLEEIQRLVDGLAALPGQQQWVADVTALNGVARDLQRPIQAGLPRRDQARPDCFQSELAAGRGRGPPAQAVSPRAEKGREKLEKWPNSYRISKA